VDALLRSYAENNLLTYASAISFQVFFALRRPDGSTKPAWQAVADAAKE